MRVFMVKGFARFQRRESISDAALCKAVRDVVSGLIDADLGHGLLKQRIARRGQGRRGGYRTIIAFQLEKRAVFLFGFAKNSKANLDANELVELARRGAVWLGANDTVIQRALATDELKEVECGDENENGA